MTNAAQQLLSAFNALPNESKQEVLVSLLRLSIETPYPMFTEEQLRSAADAIFWELDRKEAQT